ncbi:hypothetical protein E4U19_006469 [Claviceps sp. Clav32 group G5]|nr:hypothetical protein E4U19_006469 [Claviceps sp. Clav32 group G5]KAG6042165.1 hypothetical protein E4U39_006182 [Claviceps sp. Clav50 group G5]
MSEAFISSRFSAVIEAPQKALSSPDQSFDTRAATTERSGSSNKRNHAAPMKQTAALLRTISGTSQSSSFRWQPNADADGGARLKVGMRRAGEDREGGSGMKFAEGKTSEMTFFFPLLDQGGPGKASIGKEQLPTDIDLSGWLGSHCVDPVEIDSGKKVLTSAGRPIDQSASQNDRTTGQQDNTLRTPDR